MTPTIRTVPIILLLAACATSSPPSGGAAPGEASPGQPEGETSRDGGVLYQAWPQSRYELTTRDSIAMEMPDGSFQRQLTEKTGFLTIQLDSSAQGLTAFIRLDSMRLAYPDALVQSLVDSAVGTTWQGRIGARGNLDSLAPSRPSVFGEQVRTDLRRLLPVLPAGGVRPGETWTDSATAPLQMMTGMQVQEDRATGYQAGKWESSAGQRVITIESSTTYRVSGTGTSYGQQLEITGSGVATGSHRVSRAGRLLAASAMDSAMITINVPAVGQTVPTVITSRADLRLLP